MEAMSSPASLRATIGYCLWDANRNALPDDDEWLALPASSVEVGEEEVLAGDLSAHAATDVRARTQAGPSRTRRAADVAVYCGRGPARLRTGGHWAGGGVAICGPNAEEKLRRNDSAGVGPALSVQLALAGAPVQWDAPVRGCGRADRKPPSFVALARNQLAPRDALDLLFSEAMKPVALEGFWDGERFDASTSGGLAVASAQLRPLCARRTAGTGCVLARGDGRSARGPGRQWPRR